MKDDCVFCRIVAGEVPADVVVETERVVAFRDISPQAPLHVVVVPREHHTDVAALAAVDPGALGELVEVANEVAEREAAGEYRLVFNTGPDAGQSVFHAHGHVLGGRRLEWPPG
jgi:histidine triad (HIT) family protein